ncbi:MAG: hypothetical protein IJQ90_01015 [Alphaproteobacteria bacterium]|nr:hypothetical protein [Alphaproteobacteria bacterium]
MRKFIVFLGCVFIVFSAFGTGENIPTSKDYVDTAVAVKQDKILANDGTAQALTNTGTAGEYGTKGIYDSTGEYSAQTDALIDAVTMNTAVQNAIDSEFQCIEYNPNDPTDCWIMDIWGTTGKSTLPTGYTALEYIESTGTQYIDTGVQYTNNTQQAKYDIDFQITNFNTKDGALWGVLGTSQRSGCLWVRSSRQRVAISMGETTSNQSNIQIPIDTLRHHAIFEGGLSATNNNVSVKFDDTVYNDTYTYNSASMGRNRNIHLFVGYVVSGYPPIQMKLYHFQIWLDNELKFDGVPAKYDTNGTIGMYDTVTNTFFTNSGTGEFIAGPVANLYLPAGQ